MTEENLFSDQPADPKVDESKDYLSELVGEGKKFKDHASLARGKAESDLYIEQLKRELAGLRGELNQRLTLEDFMTKMKEGKETQTPSKVEETVTPEKKPEKPSITPEDIETLLDKKLREKEAVNQAKTNLNFVKQELSRHFGTDFQSKLKDRLSSLGIGEDFANEVAAKSPKAFLSLLGVDEKPNPQPNTPRGTVNSGSFTPTAQQAGIKTFKDYEKMRKENPAQFWTPAIQNEIFKRASEMGEAFYS